ncbi:MAG: hypothetical protein ABIJ65_08425 [Chloroflexota bacterium]
MKIGKAVFLIIAILLLFIITINTTSQVVLATPNSIYTPSPKPTLEHRPATADELESIMTLWSQSGHADTYDEGMGANTTCASCKSPMNWDPAAPAVEESHNCASCKRVAGMPRPDLSEGIPVSQVDWQNISCNICHEPVGDSYYITASLWNNQIQAYEPVSDTNELCAHCHEGRHGFEVMEEQSSSVVHKGWECIQCHGAHSNPVTCQECHDPTQGDGAAEHERHTGINCTACHDASLLGIWQESNPNSPHFGEIITVKFAHTITSWPSHDLQKEVACQRCHHPRGSNFPPVAAEVPCDECHVDGAVLDWCTDFQRDVDPNADFTPQP